MERHNGRMGARTCNIDTLSAKHLPEISPNTVTFESPSSTKTTIARSRQSLVSHTGSRSNAASNSGALSLKTCLPKLMSFCLAASNGSMNPSGRGTATIPAVETAKKMTTADLWMPVVFISFTKQNRRFDLLEKSELLD